LMDLWGEYLLVLWLLKIVLNERWLVRNRRSQYHLYCYPGCGRIGLRRLVV